MTFNRGGRPPFPYDQELADYICEQLATKSYGLARVCSEDGMPSVTTVFKWLRENASFAQLYADAREAQGHLLADETLDIADDSANDWEERKHFAGDDESPQVNGEAIARAKLRIDTRKWHAAHLAPKKYGDHLKVDQTVGVSTDLAALLNRTAITGQRLIASDVEEKDE